MIKTFNQLISVQSIRGQPSDRLGITDTPFTVDVLIAVMDPFVIRKELSFYHNFLTNTDHRRWSGSTPENLSCSHYR